MRTMEPTASLATTADHGPAVETQIVGDMLRRALPAVPVLLIAGALGWGTDGALSTLFAVVLVAANFALSAWMLAWSARISLAVLMMTSMFGYLLRLGLIAAAVLAVKDARWVALWPLGLTIIVTHLGLLFWEMRFISASLAFPGLKPKTSSNQDLVKE